MKKVKYLVGALAIASLSIACGGNTENTDSTNKGATTETTETQTDQTQEKAQKEIEITVVAAGNTMADIHYEPAAITVEAGSKVIVTLINESTAAGMLHNFVLVPQGAGEEIARAGWTMADNDYVPEDDRIVVASKMLDMGEETTFEFDAPAAGSYHFVCTYPGHYPQMVGRFTVK